MLFYLNVHNSTSAPLKSWNTSSIYGCIVDATVDVGLHSLEYLAALLGMVAWDREEKRSWGQVWSKNLPSLQRDEIFQKAVWLKACQNLTFSYLTSHLMATQTLCILPPTVWSVNVKFILVLILWKVIVLAGFSLGSSIRYFAVDKTNLVFYLLNVMPQ